MIYLPSVLNDGAFYAICPCNKSQERRSHIDKYYRLILFDVVLALGALFARDPGKAEEDGEDGNSQAAEAARTTSAVAFPAVTGASPRWSEARAGAVSSKVAATS